MYRGYLNNKNNELCCALEVLSYYRQFNISFINPNCQEFSWYLCYKTHSVGKNVVHGYLSSHSGYLGRYLVWKLITNRVRNMLSFARNEATHFLWMLSLKQMIGLAVFIRNYKKRKTSGNQQWVNDKSILTSYTYLASNFIRRYNRDK